MGTHGSTVGAGNECDDINECHVGNGGCEQVCVNDPGAYHCLCNSGYNLHEDAHHCVPHCSRPCEHGSLCLLSEQCVGCDVGWEGQVRFNSILIRFNSTLIRH